MRFMRVAERCIVAVQRVLEDVRVPVAFSAFPEEVVGAPRSWVERAYPALAYYNKVDKGGHFPAWEEPELLAKELRAAFRSVR